jgi:uncharacterized iron-regulated membrane protein
MRTSFRQSMTWLHTWVGLLVGWVLFFVFLTGTFGYVNAELDRWMRPEQPLFTLAPPVADMLRLAEPRLRAQAPNAESWWIGFPRGRESSILSIAWRVPPTAGEESRRFTQEVLDYQTGLPTERKVRETGGGQTLYMMHYALHYMPPLWGFYIVGISTMFMLVAIFTGVVAHKKIFKELFTFRPAKGQRSWLDGHNLLGVTGLPFHVMITWSGLAFFIFTYMPVAIEVLYPNGDARARFNAQAYSYDLDSFERSAESPVGQLAPIGPMLMQAEKLWRSDAVSRIRVDNPGRANARVTIYGPETTSIEYGKRALLRFDGATGGLVAVTVGAQTGAGRFIRILLGLHEGRFAEPFLRFLYVIAGLVGTAMVGTGLLLWSTKRKGRLKQTARPHFGIAVVDVLNLGTIIGLPIGIAAYFWANRLLSVEMPGRAAWEVHVMFITWGLTFLYAAIRPLDRAWIELCGLAAAACTLLPLLNALITERHLGATIPTGDWSLASIDLGMLASGLFFAFLARTMQRKQVGELGKVSHRSSERPRPAAEAAE